MSYKQNSRVAALMVILSGLMFASMGACIKTISVETPNEVIVFFRNLFGLIVLLPFLFRHGVRNLITHVPQWHFFRALMGLGAMYCFFYSIAHIPLSESVLLSYTTPLFAPVIAYFWLKESVSRSLKVALLIGFIGVTFLIKPDIEEFSPASIIALASGLFAAIAMTAVRRLSRTEPTTRIVFYYSLVCTLLSFLPFFLFHEWPMWETLAVLCGVGFFATLGQLCLTMGFAKASVAQVGPFIYSAVVFATIYGWLFWREAPDMVSALGIILVIAAGSIALSRPRLSH